MISEILDERINPNRLFGNRCFMFNIELASAFGLAEIEPVRSFITGSMKSGHFYKGFQQHRIVCVFIFPVDNDFFCDHAKQP